MVHSISSSSIGDSSSPSPSPSPVIFKRKRSKRYRILAPPPSNSAIAIATASSASSNTTEEDHDMADCLILLAQGPPVPFKESAAPLLKPSVHPTVYECKTCNKCFSSFQALGGHRASHKKPKLTPLETELLGSMAKPIASSSSIAAGKNRIHQCSVCGTEFSSGQALGGHMRRHRPALLLENRLETNRTENKVLLLDLNLPAPADDDDGASRSQLLDY